MKSEPRRTELPPEPVDRITGPLAKFLHIEAASGVVLFVFAISALVLANSAWSASFEAFWKTSVGFRIGDFEISHSLRHWINDGLMTIFFFVVGLEVKRELVTGELREFRRAFLPISAAIGGMVCPALLYLMLESGPGARGWGIPMATDIAFLVGCVALLGSRVPKQLKIMPIFAFANAGVVFSGDAAATPVALAVIAGLVIGKPVGILVFSWLAVRFGRAQLPEGVTWTMMLAGGCLTGIGFTMALFIADLALESPMLEQAKTGILIASGASAVVGMSLLGWAVRKNPASS